MQWKLEGLASAPSSCCAAAAWVRRRRAVSFAARGAFYDQLLLQDQEELESAEQGRSARVVSLATLRLELPEALRPEAAPSRLDMCATCASLLEKVRVCGRVCLPCPACLSCLALTQLKNRKLQECGPCTRLTSVAPLPLLRRPSMAKDGCRRWLTT